MSNDPAQARNAPSESDLAFRQIDPAEDPAQVKARHEANRAGWNQGAVAYTREIQQTIDFLRQGGSNLHPVERRNLAHVGPLDEWCRTAIHLQCASGRDTLSLWNEGVQAVIGVDISDVHIANAQRISAALDAPARWVRCDVLDTPHELDGTADLVYTGRGALCWLHDLDGWAAVIHRLLRPGGVFHVLDGHPIEWLFDSDAADLRPTGIPYFGYAEVNRGWPATYIGDEAGPIEAQAHKYERGWTMAEVVQSLIDAGLRIELFGEHPEDYWESFPNLPAELAATLPKTFSILARRE